MHRFSDSVRVFAVKDFDREGRKVRKGGKA